MATPLSRKLRWAMATVLIIVILGISFSAITLQSLNHDTQKKLPVSSAVPIIPETKETESANIMLNPLIIRDDKIQDVKMPD